MSEIRPLRNFIDRLFGTVPKQPSPSTPLPKPQPRTMKTSDLLGIKTVGVETGIERYGGIPRTKEEVQIGIQQARNEREEHEKEISAPIKSYNQGVGSSFGSQMGGIGLTDPAIARGVAQWDAEQRALFAPFKVGEIRSTSPILMGHSLQPA